MTFFKAVSYPVHGGFDLHKACSERNAPGMLRPQWPRGESRSIAIRARALLDAGKTIYRILHPRNTIDTNRDQQQMIRIQGLRTLHCVAFDPR